VSISSMSSRGISSRSRQRGAEIFDPRLTLCKGGECLTQVGGISIYMDDSHLAGSQVGILESNLREVLQGAMRN